MLDIVIPHYNEPWYICRKLLWTLNMQRIVNWDEISVTVVNDGGNRMPEEELEKLDYLVVQLDIPRGGVSAARNAGLDHADEPWIMFCDSDDAFTNIYALEEILQEIRANPECDVIWTQCVTEFGCIVVPIEPWRAFAFTHGKAYRRQFLLDNGIRFEEGRSYGEDTMFNYEVMAKTNRIRQAKTSMPAYSWIRRGGSVTSRKMAEMRK